MISHSNNYQLRLKKRGFDPSPIAGNIPYWADEISNPRCVGTTAHEDFWNEQIDRCINGYETAGIKIPGRYYYYLNLMPLKGLKGSMYPLYVDLDLEYYNLVDYVKVHKKMGIISPKARRKGLSEKAKTILSHGIRFIPGYRGAITAGLETYVTGIRKKFEHGENAIRKEFRLNVLQDNEKIYQPGYEIKDPIGGYIIDGYNAMLSFETMYDDATKLEGEYFNDVICEESGQYKLLGQVIESIKPALEFGSEMIGSFWIFGTGGNILSTSKDFKDLWDNADIYNLEKFWVPGTRLYYPFFGNPLADTFEDPDNGKIIDSIPNLRKYQLWEIIGCEDVVAAEDYILKKRIEYSKLPNKAKLKKHNQSYPLTIEEAFTSGGSNNFDDEKIYNKLFQIEGKLNNYKEVVLEWSKNEEDSDSDPVVSARPATVNDPVWKRVMVLQEPRKDVLDLDIGGLDGYNQDQTKTGSSLGAMVVMRQGNRVNMVDSGIRKSEYPVCLYYYRPPRKEDFYDICLKIAVWYGLKNNVMCSAEQDFVIDYFKKNGGTKYLSPRPKTFDTRRGQQVHKYGAKMTGSSKEIILGIVQSWVIDYVDDCEFPLILRDLLAYDEAYIGTDWDSVDAIAYAKMRIEDMKTRPRKSNDDEDMTPEIIWIPDERGNMILVEKQRAEDQNKQLHTTESTGNWRKG
jgi:hypothetical protein